MPEPAPTSSTVAPARSIFSRADNTSWVDSWLPEPNAVRGGITSRQRPDGAGLGAPSVWRVGAEGDETVEERWRGIGIRIEDDVLVTADGHENLTAALPKEIDDVEAARVLKDPDDPEGEDENPQNDSGVFPDSIHYAHGRLRNWLAEGHVVGKVR